MVYCVEVVTFNRHSARPELAARKRQEYLRAGRDWRVPLSAVRHTREVIARASKADAEAFADLIKSDARTRPRQIALPFAQRRPMVRIE